MYRKDIRRININAEEQKIKLKETIEANKEINKLKQMENSKLNQELKSKTVEVEMQQM